MAVKARGYGVSPHDHSRGRGGYDGEWFDVKGVTNVRFLTPEAAIAAIKKRLRGWKEEDMPNINGVVFKKPGRSKYVVVYEIY